MTERQRLDQGAASPTATLLGAGAAAGVDEGVDEGADAGAEAAPPALSEAGAGGLPPSAR